MITPVSRHSAAVYASRTSRDSLLLGGAIHCHSKLAIAWRPFALRVYCKPLRPWLAVAGSGWLLLPAAPISVWPVLLSLSALLETGVLKMGAGNCWLAALCSRSKLLRIAFTTISLPSRYYLAVISLLSGCYLAAIWLLSRCHLAAISLLSRSGSDLSMRAVQYVLCHGKCGALELLRDLDATPNRLTPKGRPSELGGADEREMRRDPASKQ